jgi:Mrp family chromosome partitioning ATPase
MLDSSATLPVVAPPDEPETDGRWREMRVIDGRIASAPYPDRDYPVAIRDEETPESFFHLFATLERLSENKSVIGVTSAVVGEGKTTIALHLARSIASSSYRRVCLLDLSLGEDDLCRRVGAAPAPGGLIQFLEKGQSFAGLVWPGPEALTLLPAGGKPTNAARSARSPRIAELIAALRLEYDLIIVDLPAFNSDNAVALAQQMDSVILVARAGATPRGLIHQAIEVLGRDLVTGVVLNRVTSARRKLFKWGRAR